MIKYLEKLDEDTSNFCMCQNVVNIVAFLFELFPQSCYFVIIWIPVLTRNF